MIKFYTGLKRNSVCNPIQVYKALKDSRGFSHITREEFNQVEGRYTPFSTKTYKTFKTRELLKKHVSKLSEKLGLEVSVHILNDDERERDYINQQIGDTLWLGEYGKPRIQARV